MTSLLAHTCHLMPPMPPPVLVNFDGFSQNASVFQIQRRKSHQPILIVEFFLLANILSASFVVLVSQLDHFIRKPHGR